MMGPTSGSPLAFRCSKTRTFQGDFSTRKTDFIINRLQGLFVTIVTKITFFVPNSVTKMKSRTSLVVIGDLIFGLKEKKWRFRGLRKTVTIRWRFRTQNTIGLLLKHSKLQVPICVFCTKILPYSSTFLHTCLVWLVYLIHEPNRTSDESFSFNPKTFWLGLLIPQAPNLRWVRSKTDTYLCGARVFEVIYYSPCIHLGQTGE